MFDDLVAGTAGTCGAQAVAAWARVESAACARRLAAMVTMLDAAHTASDSADRDQWCIDNWAAVCAHIGAAQRITSGAASELLLVGTALRDRFPKVQSVFAAGLIDYRLARTIVNRSLLVTDPHVLRSLDIALARALRTWKPLSQEKTERTIDAFVERLDPLALRRTQTQARGRSVNVVFDDGSGMADLFGTLFAHDAAALDARVQALADTVCRSDPRTIDQRRADAMGALAHGADRLACLCDTDDCTAAANPPSSGVVIHLIAHHDTIPDGPGPDGPTPDGPTPDHPETDAPRPTANAVTQNNDSAVAPELERAVADRATAECAGLDGLPPRMFSTPLREMTLSEVMTPRDPGPLSSVPPAMTMGGRFLPGAIARRAAVNATVESVVHPGLAQPEPRYRPSKKLADFVRSRDLTCRYPGCRVPATNCDLDHTIAWPEGPTQASNLKCLCRKHHLLKTFWTGDGGWRDRQLANGDVIWTTPDGRDHTTSPGSRLLFPTLCEPTARVGGNVTHARPRCAAGLTMPRRRRTRSEDRVYRIQRERELNEAEAAAHPAGPDSTAPF